MQLRSCIWNSVILQSDRKNTSVFKDSHNEAAIVAVSSAVATQPRKSVPRRLQNPSQTFRKCCLKLVTSKKLLLTSPSNSFCFPYGTPQNGSDLPHTLHEASQSAFGLPWDPDTPLKPSLEGSGRSRRGNAVRFESSPQILKFQDTPGVGASEGGQGSHDTD